MNEAVELLRSIDKTLKDLLALSQRRVAASAAAAPAVAPDRDLDGQWGNPTVTQKDPRDWTGPSMKGRRFSECPAEYLDMIADRFDYFAQKADESGERLTNGKPAAEYKRKDAARARGWAKRVREGKGHTFEAAPAGDNFDAEEFPEFPAAGDGFGDDPFDDGPVTAKDVGF